MTTASAAPVLTVVVPAYNAQDYLRRALDPLRAVPGIEVIIVDDGSTDGTAALAEEYVRAAPDTYRVVHQRNAGHGGAINTGLTHARGEYFKVLDADDWFDIGSLVRVVSALESLRGSGGVDALFSDYVHERLGKSSRRTRFGSAFPADRRFRWDEVERLGRRQILMMHAVTYRTDLLRRVGMRLPEHTFYVDNLFVVAPLAHVREMYYLPVDLYRYFIGRSDQSVNASVMLTRVDQQLRVNRLALQALPSREDVADGTVPVQLYAMLLQYLEAVCAVTSATLVRGGTPEHLAARELFWDEIRAENPWLFTRLRRTLVGTGANLPGQAGRRVTRLAYHVARRVVGFS
jgi:Glycosyltransferases involved in cell wall biogenesis